VGIFGTIWGYIRLKEISVKSVHEKFDYAGTILYCIGLATILTGADDRRPHFAAEYCYPCRGNNIFYCGHSRRAEAEESYSRFADFLR